MEFKTQTFTISDLYNWHRSGELVLSPKFQRRLVWSQAAKSYLIDTVARGLPMPKIYFRMQIDPVEVKSVREVIDGQQRLDAIFRYIEGEFRVSKSHNDVIGRRYFADLPPDVQSEILSYDVSADLLIGASDKIVLQIFARINSYSVQLNAQEKRNAEFFGLFKKLAYDLSTEHLAFWRRTEVLSEKNIARMQEAELTSELIVGLLAGLQDKKASINRFYRLYEDRFPAARSTRGEFEQTIAWIDDNIGEDVIAKSAFSRRSLFYSLFLAVADGLFGIPSGQGVLPRMQRKAPSQLARAKLKDNLLVLSRAVQAKSPPAGLAEFIVAAARQTDNVGPRRIRHRRIHRALRESL